MTPNSARARGIAVIWQDLALFAEMTVAENIAFEHIAGRRFGFVDQGRLRRIAAESLQKLGVDLDLDARLATLPIAQRQLAAVARALASDARIIFMDEPTASLTRTETNRLLEVVGTLSANGVAVVFVSHRLAEVLQISSRVTVLRDGKLIGVFPTLGMTQSHLTELMTGKTFDSAVSARDVSSAPKVLEVEGLSRKGEFDAIDLTLRAGEIVGLTGLMGAGRTELGHTLFGMTRPDRGTIRLLGKPVTMRSNRDAVALGIAYVSEDRLALGLIQPQSIADNLVITVLPQISGPDGLISSDRKRRVVDHWLREFAVKIGRPGHAIATLSGGNQQRVVLGKWLATEPKVLILDSPTVGVDVGARAGIYRIVRELAEKGLAILLICDEVPEAYFNADRVLHMAGGRIVAEYDPRDVPLSQIEEAVYA